jgi:SulP family sulfate permease
LIPKLVISGFMNGIAVLIWIGEIGSLFGLGGKTAYLGNILTNLSITCLTLGLIFMLPVLLRQISARLNSFFPATLIAIVIVTLLSVFLDLDVQRVSLGGSIESLMDLQNMVISQLPTQWSFALILLAVPFVVQLTMLAYLDTLLTSLVVDRKVEVMHGHKDITKPNQELCAQGIANAAVSLFGGIPGAQATIRSVLILNEGATMRLAGVLVGIFVLIEMLMFQDLISLIPQAVFSGVLLKVGYDVFDWVPLRQYCYHVLGWSRTQPHLVSHTGIALIMGTTLVTVLVNLSVAVIAFTIMFYAIRKFLDLEDLRESLD